MCNWINQNNADTFSAWLGVVSFISSIIFGIWIATSLQDKQQSKRAMKDHFISEINSLNNFYFNFMNEILSDRANIKSLIPMFKTMNIKISKIMQILNERYAIDTTTLSTYQIGLRNTVLDSNVYIDGFRAGGLLIIDSQLTSEILMFRQRNEHLFNELILRINDSKDLS